MTRRSTLERLVLVINSVGLGLYLVWLVFRAHKIFYTQDGVLYLLPCLPFIFVYLFIFGKRNPSDDAVE